MRHYLKLYIDDDGEIAYIERIANVGSQNKNILENIEYFTKVISYKTGDTSNLKPDKFVYKNKTYEKINIGIDLYATKNYKLNRRLKLIKR